MGIHLTVFSFRLRRQQLLHTIVPNNIAFWIYHVLYLLLEFFVILFFSCIAPAAMPEKKANDCERGSRISSTAGLDQVKNSNRTI